MNFGNKNIDYYVGYNSNAFFTICELQKHIPKLFVNTELLNAAIFWYTNLEREKYGLPQFQFHGKLMQMAILHSEQMRQYKFFNHENKYDSRYKTLSDRLEQVKDDSFQGFMSFAENIADIPVIKANKSFTTSIRDGGVHFYTMDGNEFFPYTYSEMAQSVVDAWMNSPGHRANILNLEYHYLGCGCAPYEYKKDGYSKTYFKLTQNFGGELVSPSIIEIAKQTFRTVLNPHGTDKNSTNALFGDWGQNKNNKNNMAEEIYFGQGENPENGQEKTLCVFLLDNSGSMSGSKMANLNNGLKEFYQDILDNEALSQRLEVAIVSFASSVRYLQQPAIAENFTMPELIAMGGTDMVGGIKKAIEVVEERKRYYIGHGIAYKRPWIVMVTDGYANVDSIKEQVKNDSKAKHYFFQPIAVDDGADMNVLNSLATIRAFKLRDQNFSTFFKWLSNSLAIIEQAKPGDAVQLDDPFKAFAV